MAVRTAVATGNWSAPATWDGGVTVPGAGDDVWANNFTVTIDQNVTVATLRNSASASAPVAAVGGTFLMTSGKTLTVTGDILAAHYRSTAGATVGFTAGSYNCTINLANVIAANSSNTVNFVEIQSALTGGTVTINCTGLLTGGGSTGGRCIGTPATGGARTVNINFSGSGAIVGASGASGAIGVEGSGTTVNISIASIINTGIHRAIYVGGSTLNMSSCSMAASSSSTNSVVLYLAGGTTTLTSCTVAGSSTNDFPTVQIASSSAVLTMRDCTIKPGTASGGSPALSASASTTTARVRISGDIYCGGVIASTGPDGFFPITGQFTADTGGSGLRIRCLNDTSFPTSNAGTATILSMYGSASGLPVPADVRSGTAFGPSGAYTGTLAVPPAASVQTGVPVDNVTGTGAVLLADIAAITGAQIAAATDA